MHSETLLDLMITLDSDVDKIEEHNNAMREQSRPSVRCAERLSFAISRMSIALLADDMCRRKHDTTLEDTLYPDGLRPPVGLVSAVQKGKSNGVLIARIPPGDAASRLCALPP